MAKHHARLHVEHEEDAKLGHGVPLAQSCLQRCPYTNPVNSQRRKMWSLGQSGATMDISNGKNPKWRTANTGVGTVERDAWRRQANPGPSGREVAPHRGPCPGQQLGAGAPAQQKADLSQDVVLGMGRKDG